MKSMTVTDDKGMPIITMAPAAPQEREVVIYDDRGLPIARGVFSAGLARFDQLLYDRGACVPRPNND